MKHCILSYFESAYQKKYVAFSVSKNNKNYTLGFKINNRNKNILVFDQLYGYKNQPPSSELQTQVLKALEVKLE